MMGRLSEAGGISHKSHDIKKYMNLFISRAAREIVGKKVPYDSIVGGAMLESYNAVLDDASAAGEIPVGLSLSLLKRRKNFEKDDDDKDKHTSKSLWRKWGDIKTKIKRVFMPIYEDTIAPGIEPSDELLEIVLTCIRAAEEKSNSEAVQKAELQEAALSGSSNIKRLKTSKVHPNWIPNEWLTFLKLGPPALIHATDLFGVIGEKKEGGKKRKIKSSSIDIDNVSASSSSSSSSSSYGNRKKAKDESSESIENQGGQIVGLENNENLEESKKQKELAATELAIYNYNIALSSRKLFIQKSKELIELEIIPEEKKKLSASLKEYLLTPPPEAPARTEEDEDDDEDEDEEDNENVPEEEVFLHLPFPEEDMGNTRLV